MKQNKIFLAVIFCVLSVPVLVSARTENLPSATSVKSDSSVKEDWEVSEDEFGELELEFEDMDNPDELDELELELELEELDDFDDPDKIDEFDEVESEDDFDDFMENILLEDEDIEDIFSDDDDLEISYHEPVKFLGFIPVEISARISVSKDKEVEVKFPWYSFFYDLPDDIELSVEKIEKALAKSLQTELQSAIQEKARTIEVVSNVLKTKHDTAKNSINNVR